MFSRLKRLLSRREALGPFPADTRLESMRYVVVDTELTSLDHRSNRLLSIGAIAMQGMKIRLGEQFYAVVNPEVSVPAETVLIHGLRPIDVVEGVSPKHAVAEFLDFADDAALAGHFIGIDLAAMKKEVPTARQALENPAIDTCRVQCWLNQRRNAYREDRGHQVDSVDLLSLAKRYGLEVPEAHHALYDAFLTAQLWQRLMYELGNKSVRTLGELMRIGKAEAGRFDGGPGNS